MPKLIWAGYGGFSGWAHWGTRRAAELLPGDDFWARAARVAAAAEGGRVDAVQCYDSAIMTAGPLQGTAAFHYLQHLLGNCWGYDPEGFIACMTPAMFDGNADPVVEVRQEPRSPSGWALFYPGRDEPLLSAQQLRAVFLGGSDGRTWTQPQRDHARRWVECLVELLGDHGGFDHVVVQHSGWLLRRFLDPLSRTQLAGLAVSERARERLTACHLAYAINNPTGARRLLGATLAARTPSAETYLGLARSARPDTFPKRVASTRARLDAEWPSEPH